MDSFVDPMFDPDDEIYAPDTKSIDDVDLLKPIPIDHPAIEKFKRVPTVVIGAEVP